MRSVDQERALDLPFSRASLTLICASSGRKGGLSVFGRSCDGRAADRDADDCGHVVVKYRAAAAVRLMMSNVYMTGGRT